MNKITYPLVFAFVLFFIGCNTNHKEQPKIEKEFLSSLPKVKTMLVKESAFFMVF